MSADAAHAYEDDIAARMKKHLEDNPDVAEQIFEWPVGRIVQAKKDEVAGLDVHVDGGEFRRVWVAFDAQSLALAGEMLDRDLE